MASVVCRWSLIAMELFMIIVSLYCFAGYVQAMWLATVRGTEATATRIVGFWFAGWLLAGLCALVFRVLRKRLCRPSC
jgi:hypothetical protein